MSRGLLAGVAVLAVCLVAAGVWLDAAFPLPQTALWASLHAASLGGAALAFAALRARFPGGAALGLAAAQLVAWRLAYFPIMVFSGHVASIVEWLLLVVGLPVLVYPVFLVSVATLHGAAGALAGFALRPPLPALRWAAVLAFGMASLVSVTKAPDLHPLPDRFWSLSDPSPPPVAAVGNPYLPALIGPGYFPTQRVMLVAAGLTYATIPPSPWATTVKSVLEADFRANPRGSTADRVREHYLAYHSAHPYLGCRGFEACPLPPLPEDDPGS